MKTQKEKIEYLKTLGYDEAYLQVITEGIKARFTLDQLIFLESKVGKIVSIETKYNNETIIKNIKVEKMDAHVISACFYANNRCYQSITPKSVQHAMEKGSFTRDRSEYDYLGNGRLKYKVN